MEQEIITQPPLPEVQANDERQGDLLQKYERRFEKKKKLPRRPEAVQIVLRSRFEFGRSLTILQCPSITEWSEESIVLPRKCVTLRRKGKMRKRLDRKRCTIRPCLAHKKFAKHTEDTALKLKFHLYSKTKPLLGLDL